MTLIVAGAGVLLALVVGSLTVVVGHVAQDRARAQTAADAAALAAAAEAGPYGSGQPLAEARRFAQANGARFLSCACSQAGSVVVTAGVGVTTARARAVLDPALLAPAAAGTDAGGLDPRLAAAVNDLLAGAHGAVTLTSGYRSPEHQARLWAAAVNQYGSPEAADDWVARPGHSMHERGLAVDLGGDLELAVRLVERLGLPLYRPLANEPWHFELLGSRNPPA